MIIERAITLLLHSLRQFQSVINEQFKHDALSNRLDSITGLFELNYNRHFIDLQ